MTNLSREISLKNLVYTDQKYPLHCFSVAQHSERRVQLHLYIQYKFAFESLLKQYINFILCFSFLCFLSLISFSEFLAFEALLCDPGAQHKLVFQLFDLDGKGSVAFGTLFSNDTVH